MAYTMIHIMVAEEVLGLFPKIEDYNTYILGTIAPDAVHSILNYEMGMKERSHIFAKGLHWGEICSYADANLWLDSIKKFYYQNIDIYNRDFLIGYVVHLIVDVYSSICFYTPFIDSINKNDNKIIDQYKRESFNVNYYLYILYSKNRELHSVLTGGKHIMLSDLINKEVLQHRVEQLFSTEFKERDISDINNNIYCKIDDMYRLIHGATYFINKVLVNDNFSINEDDIL